MDRLTERNRDGIAFSRIPMNESRLLDVEHCYTGFVADRLAAYEDTMLTPEGVAALRARVAELESENNVVGKALELAVESDASNFCVFNGIEKELWPDYCKNPPETKHKTCVMCWRSYYIAKAGGSNG